MSIYAWEKFVIVSQNDSFLWAVLKAEEHRTADYPLFLWLQAIRSVSIASETDVWKLWFTQVCSGKPQLPDHYEILKCSS